MSNTDVLAAREKDEHLNDSIGVGLYMLGMPLDFTGMTEADVEKWMKWHDEWEPMGKGIQDSYLILLALGQT